LKIVADPSFGGSAVQSPSPASQERPNKKESELLGEAFLNAIRLAVREEIREALMQGGFSFDDRLLNIEEASKGAAGFAGLALPQLSQIAVHTGIGAQALRFSYRGIHTCIRRDVSV
jgi:hypothetical protein